MATRAASPTSAGASRASHPVYASSCSGDDALGAVGVLTIPSCRRPQGVAAIWPVAFTPRAGAPRRLRVLPPGSGRRPRRGRLARCAQRRGAERHRRRGEPAMSYVVFAASAHMEIARSPRHGRSRFPRGMAIAVHLANAQDLWSWLAGIAVLGSDRAPLRPVARLSLRLSTAAAGAAGEGGMRSSEGEPLSPVAAGDRILELDVVRGFALIGIFLMNVEFFNRSINSAGEGMPVGLTGLDWFASWF